jgi:O-antigen ligase
MNPVPDRGPQVASLPEPEIPSLRLQVAVVVHLAVLLVFTTWAFGGNVAWARTAAAVLASGGVILTAIHLAGRPPVEIAKTLLRSLWPLLALNVVVLAGLFNPSFGTILMDGEVLARRLREVPHLPTTARPSVSLQALWVFDATVLSCFNLYLIVRRRRLLRTLLVAVTLNAVLLAVFGTLQYLARSPGLYFGAVGTPQPYFFATFIYHNHWGAYALLMIAATLAIAWGLFRSNRGRDRLHSPVLTFVVAALLVAVTVPMSGSRSCTVCAALLLVFALVHLVVVWLKSRRSARGTALPLLAGLALVGAFGAVVFDAARPMLAVRAETTRLQLRAAHFGGELGARPSLYRDTARMALAKPLFGWGMGSYPVAFQIFNRRDRQDRWAGLAAPPIYYVDAHSDWLQSLAELGFVGTALVILLAAVPALSLRNIPTVGPLPLFLLAGCGLVAVYAAVEFPFGNLAVVQSWWLCYYTAIGYLRLGAAEAGA